MEDQEKIADDSEPEVIYFSSKPRSAREQFYLDWGRDLLKNHLNLLNDLFKHHITICVGLLTVSVVFDELFKDNDALRFFTVLLFVLSLVAGGAGIFPYERTRLNLDDAKEIEEYQKSALKYKKSFYLVAILFALFGILMILFSLFKKSF